MTRAKNRALSSTTAGVGAISTPSSASRSAPTAARTPAALRGTCVCFPGRRDPAGTSYPSGESAPLRSSHFWIGNLTKLIFICRYFDNFEKRCMPFYYGGCEGNLNRFDSQEDCQRSCPSEFLQNDVCQMKQEPGPCRDFLQRLDPTCRVTIMRRMTLDYIISK